MKITLTSFENLSIEPRYGNYRVDLSMEASANDLVEGLEEDDKKELIGAFRPEDIVTFNDVDEILEAIGIDRIKQYLIEHD